MKQFKKLTGLFTLLIISLSLVSCDYSSITKLTQNESQKFDNFLEKEFTDYISSDYLTLHYSVKNPSKYNIDEPEITLGSLDIESFEEYDKDIQDTKDTLNSFNYSKLNEKQQLTYDILNEYLTTELISSGLYYYQSILKPTTGLQTNLPITFSEYTFYNKDDAYNYIKLLEDVDNYFDDIIEFETAKSEKGLFMSSTTADSVISEINDFIKNPESNYLIKTFDDRINELSDLSDTEKNDLSKTNKDIIINNIIPSYEKLSNTLSTLKSTSKNSGGLCNFEDGKKYYEYLLARNTGSSKSVDKIKTILEDRLAEIITKFQSIAKNSPDTILAMSDENFASTSMTDPSEILEYLKTKISYEYPTGPSTNYTIKYVDESLEEASAPAFYMIPPIDDYENNTVYINKTQVNNTNLFPTLAHEAYPGHLYQTTYFNNTDPYPIRKALSFDGYVEGWATYAEINSYSISGIQDYNTINLQKTLTEMNLALPTLLDIYINYDGWSREQVNTYLFSNGYDNSLTDYLYNISIANPTYYSKYYVGYLEFVELQDKAMSSLNEDFEIKNFNKILLDVGPAPFGIIEKKVDKFIEDNTKNK